MADGLCTGDTVSNVIEKTYGKEFDRVIECMDIERVKDVDCANVKSFYISSDSDKLFDKLCSVKGPNVEKHEGFLVMEMPCSPSPGEEDCRKKRCADRYDSSESSDRSVRIFFPFFPSSISGTLLDPRPKRAPKHKEGTTSFFFDYSNYAAASALFTCTKFGGPSLCFVFAQHGHCHGLYLHRIVQIETESVLVF